MPRRRYARRSRLMMECWLALERSPRRACSDLLILLQPSKQHSCQTRKAAPITRSPFVLLEFAMQSGKRAAPIGPDLSEASESRSGAPPEMSDQHL